MRLRLFLLLAAFAGVQLAGCGSGKLEEQDATVRHAWADTMNQYQRRIDLVPDLLSRLPQLAEREPRVVAAVSEAHARAQTIPLAPALLDDSEAFARAQSAQMALGAALRELVAAADRQPGLEAGGLGGRLPRPGRARHRPDPVAGTRRRLTGRVSPG